MNIYYITRDFYTYNHLHSKQSFKIDVINRRARGGGETVKEGGRRERQRERALPEDGESPLEIT